jgi:hypothetical protein
LIGIDSKVLILHNTDSTSLRSKLYEIETNVENIQKRKEIESKNKAVKENGM